MATYRQDITQNVEPAAANWQTAARAIELEGKSIQTAIAGATNLAGMALDIKDASTKADLREELQVEATGFENSMTELKKADTQNKVMFEQSKASLPSMAEEFRASAILAGADPEQARTESTIFGQKQENALVSQFRAEQQRIVAAREAMPEQYHQFMSRSEAKLKEAIRANPSLANSFRQVAQEVTGKANLDLYSVNRLYEDVNFIQRQQEENAKAQAQLIEKQRTAYVNDRKGGGVSETQAMAEFNSFDDNTRLQLANLSAEKANASANADNALKLGGAKIGNFVTFKIAESNAQLLESSGKLIATLARDFGVTKAQIVSNTIPEHVRKNPKFMDAMGQAQAATIALIEQQYADASAKLRTQMTSEIADPAATSNALKDLETWRTGQLKFYGQDSSSLLLAVADNDDPVKTAQQRLSLINTLTQTLALPPGVVQELLTSDDKTYATTKARYPKAVKQLDYIRQLSSAAMRGVSTSEFNALMFKANDYLNNNVETVPISMTESSAAFVNVQSGIAKLSSSVLTDAPITTDDLYSVVTSAMSQPANAEEYFKKVTTMSQALSKVSESEKAELSERVAFKSRDFVYGEQGYGNKAKTMYTQLQAQDPPPYASGRNIVFASTNGLGKLRVTTTVVPQPNLTPSQQAVLKDRIRADVSDRKINSALSHVDSILRIEANITGKPIEQLRVEFMNTFNKEGMPSANAVATTMGAVANEATASGDTDEWWNK